MLYNKDLYNEMTEILKLNKSQFYSTKNYHKVLKFFYLNSVSLTAHNNFIIKKKFEKTSSKTKVTKVLSQQLHFTTV